MPATDIGVIIPTFERPYETLRAVHSVLAQTLHADHVVVVDDGSSAEVCDILTQELKPLPVEFIRGPSSAHPGRTRNIGRRALSTTWIAFLDSDDTWAPTKLERQLALTVTAAASCTNARRIVAGEAIGPVLPILRQESRLADLILQNTVINSSVLVRADVLDDVGGVASSYLVRGCEDYATWLRVATYHPWVGVDEPLVNYVDEPSVSIRGSEEFGVHAGQQAAWVDYVMWRRSVGSPTRLTERLLTGGVRRSLLLQAHRDAGPAPTMESFRRRLREWITKVAPSAS